MLLVFGVVLLAFSKMAQAGTVSKCDVVRALRNENVPDSEIRDWLCLVKHESSFRYDAINVNDDRSRSRDYGIYQLNDKYWCDRGSRSDTKCWRINTYGCGVSCASLLNDILTFDTECAVKIKRCNGFSKWYAWRDYCQGDLSNNSNYDFSHC